jgi:hypothetical protein
MLAQKSSEVIGASMAPGIASISALSTISMIVMDAASVSHHVR